MQKATGGTTEVSFDDTDIDLVRVPEISNGNRKRT